jgi:hypothetical protein
MLRVAWSGVPDVRGCVKEIRGLMDISGSCRPTLIIGIAVNLR